MLGFRIVRLARRFAAVAVGLGSFWSGVAEAQQPLFPSAPQRIVVQSSGEPGVFVVSGQAQPDVLPPSAPAALPGTAPAYYDGMSGVPCTTEACTTCKKGFCGPGTRVGPEAFDGVTFGECWSFYWRCCKSPATVPPPIGYNVKHANNTMRDNALAEYFVVYREDWLEGTATLNDTGARHVDGILRRFAMIGAPMKIEPSGNPELDALRKVALIDGLTRSGVSGQEAHERVVIGNTRAEGLRNDSVMAVYFRGRTIYSGGLGGGGVGGGGGGGGGGFGGFGGFGAGGIVFPTYGGVGR